MDKSSPSTDPCEVVILVAPSYSQLTLAALVEPLRMANTVAGTSLYRWTLCSDGRQRVESSSGFVTEIAKDIMAVEACDALFVVASYDFLDFASPPVKASLRRIARRGGLIAGLDAAPYILAEAGLLDGFRATTHWDNLEDFRNRYPRVDVMPERFVIDRQRATTSGSLPSFDFALEFIRQRNGLMLATYVSGNFLYDQARPGSEPQHMIATSQIGLRHPKIARVIEAMEGAIAAPMPMAELARSVGMSERSMLRQFKAVLGIGPKQYFRTLRLDYAKRLLDNSDLSIAEVADACGFESRASFSRAFRERFEISPSEQGKSTHR